MSIEKSSNKNAYTGNLLWMNFRIGDLAADGSWIADDDLHLQTMAKYVSDGGKDEYAFVAHGNKKMIGVRGQGMLPGEFARRLVAGEYNYKGEYYIRLHSCETGKGLNPFAEQFARSMKEFGMPVRVVAPTTRLRYFYFREPISGKVFFHEYLKNGGEWVWF